MLFGIDKVIASYGKSRDHVEREAESEYKAADGHDGMAPEDESEHRGTGVTHVTKEMHQLRTLVGEWMTVASTPVVQLVCTQHVIMVSHY